MRLLVLGGTRFVGLAIARAAVAAGHDVTLFHRTARPGLLPEVEHLLGDRDGGLGALEGRAFDGCVDVSGYVPRLVGASARLLSRSVGRYLFVSTISVYADLSQPRDEDGPLASAADPESEDVWTGNNYGALKVLCEDEVRNAFEGRATVVRPGFVVGPGDYTGRFTWWVRRGAAGGTMPLPASIARRAQFIDADDLARFTLGLIEADAEGTFNATGPVPPVGMADVARVAAALSGASLELVPVPDARVREAEIDYPLWTADPAFAAHAEVDVTRALAAGLSFRPLEETVRATLADPQEIGDLGPGPAEEAALLDG